MNAADAPIEFELHGHRYMTTLIPADEGLALVAQLFALGAEPIARVIVDALRDPAAIDTLRAALRKPAPGEPADKGPDLGALLARVDVAAAAGDLRRALAGVDAAGLIKALCRWTYRDGVALRDPAAFNAAFRGNYAELFALAVKLIGVNRLIPLSAT